MKISLEQLGRMKERRRQQTPRRSLTGGGLRWLQPVLLVLGVLFSVTFVADMYNLSHGGMTSMKLLSVPEEIQRLERDMLHGPRYTATSGLFSIVRPTGWKVLTGEDIAPYDVTLASPNGVNISLSATPVNYDDLPTLFTAMSKREKEFGVQADIQTLYFHGSPAARREVRMMRSQAVVIDFVTNRVAHQIFCIIPLESLEQYRPVLMKLVDTYQPRVTTKR
ncbi:MAG: hypothetical protein EPN23_08715 [Verrucomicrobia bacterium]|nr:MAG: hypothetical protein EPN23_08715 [Verrucomicrobiota bacterium]